MMQTISGINTTFPQALSSLETWLRMKRVDQVYMHRQLDIHITYKSKRAGSGNRTAESLGEDIKPPVS